MENNNNDLNNQDNNNEINNQDNNNEINNQETESNKQDTYSNQNNQYQNADNQNNTNQQNMNNQYNANQQNMNNQYNTNQQNMNNQYNANQQNMNSQYQNMNGQYQNNNQNMNNGYNSNMNNQYNNGYNQNMNHFENNYEIRDNSKYSSTLLWASFLGSLGIHRFVNGKIISGVIMLVLNFFTFGLVPFVWAIVDIIIILCGKFKNKQGQYIRPMKSKFSFFSTYFAIFCIISRIFFLIYIIIFATIFTIELSNSVNEPTDELNPYSFDSDDSGDFDLFGDDFDSDEYDFDDYFSDDFDLDEDLDDYDGSFSSTVDVDDIEYYSESAKEDFLDFYDFAQDLGYIQLSYSNGIMTFSKFANDGALSFVTTVPENDEFNGLLSSSLTYMDYGFEDTVICTELIGSEFCYFYEGDSYDSESFEVDEIENYIDNEDDIETYVNDFNELVNYFS